MKKLFFIFILLLIAIGLGFLIHKDPGYVIISYQDWVVSTSFWVACVTTLLSFFIVYFLIRLVSNIFAIPKMLERRRMFHDAQKYQKHMTQGISELIMGDFRNA